MSGHGRAETWGSHFAVLAHYPAKMTHALLRTWINECEHHLGYAGLGVSRCLSEAILGRSGETECVEKAII